jgi:hypothetical protein
MRPDSRTWDEIIGRGVCVDKVDKEQQGQSHDSTTREKKSTTGSQNLPQKALRSNNTTSKASAYTQELDIRLVNGAVGTVDSSGCVVHRNANPCTLQYQTAGISSFAFLHASCSFLSYAYCNMCAAVWTDCPA